MMPFRFRSPPIGGDPRAHPRVGRLRMTGVLVAKQLFRSTPRVGATQSKLIEPSHAMFRSAPRVGPTIRPVIRYGSRPEFDPRPVGATGGSQRPPSHRAVSIRAAAWG